MQTSLTGSCNSRTVIDVSGPSVKECTQTQDQVDMMCTEWPELELVFHSVDEDWPWVACAIVSVPFVKSNRIDSGGATVVLRHPHHTQTSRGDGNFRSFSYLITETQIIVMCVQLLLHTCL